MEHAHWITTLVLVLDLVIRLGLSLRIVMRRHPVGVTYAWLAVVLAIPVFGAFVYLLFGELRLGNRRALHVARINDAYQRWLEDLTKRSDVEWSELGTECQPLATLAQAVAGIAATPSSTLNLINDTDAVVEAIIADVDRAQRTVHMEFYIWHGIAQSD